MLRLIDLLTSKNFIKYSWNFYHALFAEFLLNISSFLREVELDLYFKFVLEKKNQIKIKNY